MGHGHALEGTFADLTLGDVLSLIVAAARPGVIICRGAVPATVVVSPPHVAWAEPPGAPPLDELAALAGVATADQRAAALAGAKRTGQLVPELLTAGVDPDALGELVADHLTATLLPLHTDPVRAGATTFVFDAGASHPAGTGSTSGFAVDELIAALDRRGTMVAGLAGSLPSAATPVAFRLDVDAPVTLSPDEWRAVACLGAGADAAHVAASTGWSEVRAWEVLAGLVARGLLQPHPDPG